jgi:hypothetical protein
MHGGVGNISGLSRRISNVIRDLRRKISSTGEEHRSSINGFQNGGRRMWRQSGGGCGCNRATATQMFQSGGGCGCGKNNSRAMPNMFTQSNGTAQFGGFHRSRYLKSIRRSRHRRHF